jgi:hypothetical protein
MYSAQNRVFIIMADFRSPGGMTQNGMSGDRIDSRGDMISFASFPVQPERGSEYARHFPTDEDDHIDLDDGDFEAGGSKITWPGESITSSQAYMRYGRIERAFLKIFKCPRVVGMVRMLRTRRSWRPSQGRSSALTS